VNSKKISNSSARAAVRKSGSRSVKTVHPKVPSLESTDPVNQAAASIAASAMVRAIVDGRIGTIKHFLQNKAAINAELEDQWTVLLVAAWHNELEVVQLLVRAGANHGARTRQGWTALIMAAFQNSFKMVRFLINQGAEVNASDINGKTALMWAAEKGAVEIVRLLLERGANLATKSHRNMTAYDYALREGRTEVLDFLKERGVRPSRTVSRKISAREEVPSDKPTRQPMPVPKIVQQPASGIRGILRIFSRGDKR
jgi:ankyrin repeat protein